jgi:ribosomal protein L7/L12
MEKIKVDQNAQNIAQLAAAVAQLQRTTDFILKRLGVDCTDDPASSLPPELAEKIAALLRQGKNGELDAIKLYRSQTGGGFIEATGVMEDIKKRTTLG